MALRNVAWWQSAGVFALAWKTWRNSGSQEMRTETFHCRAPCSVITKATRARRFSFHLRSVCNQISRSNCASQQRHRRGFYPIFSSRSGREIVPRRWCARSYRGFNILKFLISRNSPRNMLYIRDIKVGWRWEGSTARYSLCTHSAIECQLKSRSHLKFNFALFASTGSSAERIVSRCRSIISDEANEVTTPREETRLPDVNWNAEKNNVLLLKKSDYSDFPPLNDYLEQRPFFRWHNLGNILIANCGRVRDRAFKGRSDSF